MTNFLEIEDIQQLIAEYDATPLGTSHPLPLMATRQPGKLEAVLRIPKQRIGGNFIYSSLSKQASVLLYELIKVPTFPTHRKRIACLCLFTFLLLNDHWLVMTNDQLLTLLNEVATSKLSDRQNALHEIDEFLQRYIIPLKATIRS